MSELRYGFLFAMRQTGQQTGTAYLQRQYKSEFAIFLYFYYNSFIQAEHRAAGHGFCLLIRF